MDAGRRKHGIIGGGGSYGQQLAWRFTFFTWFNHCYGWLGGLWHWERSRGFSALFCHRIMSVMEVLGIVRVVGCGSLALVRSRSGFRRLPG